MSKSPITCHVLDSSVGKPAAGVKVSIEVISLDELDSTSPQDLPHSLATGETNEDGRCTTLLDPGMTLSPGVYKLIFHTGPYFQSQGVKTLYPFVEITFNYSDPTSHYHIPLLTKEWTYLDIG